MQVTNELEVISVPVLLARPRYLWGALFDTGTNWSRRDEVALAACCDAKASIEKVSQSIGRSVTSIAHRASDTGLVLPPEWRGLIYRRRVSNPAPKRSPLQYPYIVETKGEHVDLLAVNALVPRGLPDHVRADVCQEIMLAIWEKKYSIAEFKSSRSLVNQFIKQFRTENHEMGGYALSLDAPMQDGRSWYDILPAESSSMSVE